VAVYAQEITPGPAEWAALEQAAGSPETLAEHQARHRRGGCVVARITGEVSAVVLMWRERISATENELVIALATGRNTRAFLPWVVEFARANGCTSIRAHCRRAGLVRLFERAGFRNEGPDNEGLTIVRRKHGRR